jgi:hypothetical protein
MAAKWGISLKPPRNTLTPPITSGMVGYYTPESWTGTQWSDLSGSGNHATTVTGTINRSTERGVPYLYGSTTAGIRFPTGILPSTYTLFHVAKHNGPTRGRIFDGNLANWLSGFGVNASGLAYHLGWVANTGDLHGTNWVISTDQNALYRSQFVNRTTGSPGSPSFEPLTLNYGLNEKSDWACSVVIVFNRTLSTSEIITMENWISDHFISTYIPNSHINSGLDMTPHCIEQESAVYNTATRDITVSPDAGGNGTVILPVNLSDLGNVFRIEFDFKFIASAGNDRKGEGLIVGVSSTFGGLGANGASVTGGDTNGIYIGFNEYPNYAFSNDNRILFYMKSTSSSQNTKLSSLNLTDGNWKRAVCYFDFNQMKFRVVLPNNDISYTHNVKLTPNGNIIYLRANTGFAVGNKQVRNIQVYNSWI